MAPARTPPEILARLESASAAALREPDVVAKLREQGGIPGNGAPAQFVAQIAAESARWQRVIAAANIRIEG